MEYQYWQMLYNMSTQIGSIKSSCYEQKDKKHQLIWALVGKRSKYF